MATLNKVMLIGRLTDNPEPPRTLPNSGSTVVRFRFAVGRSKKNPTTGQWENDPNPLYIDCEVFSRPDSKRNLPDLITQWAKKGDPLYIEGRLQLDQWEKDGQKRSKHKIVVENVEFLGARNTEGEGGSAGGGRSGGYGGGKPAGKPAPTHQDDGEEYGGGGSGGGDGDPIPF